MAATYILPIRRELLMDARELNELTAYLRRLSTHLEVVVVDGSPREVFARHDGDWGALVMHVPPDADLRTPNGKVGGVLTGLRRARHEKIIVADDDVRYDDAALRRLVDLLDRAEVVRPQNYFDPLPWHARWDTARSLLNRSTGGDWPGTLGVRRSLLQATAGYDGSALFENLELVRTVVAAGGRELVPLDLFVRRLPPDGRHFWSQRIRQAYDEFARPVRLAVWLALLPSAVALAWCGRWGTLLGTALGSMGLAEVGRRRAGGRAVFPMTASVLAPLWLAERGVCAWLAVGMRLTYGGVPYRGGVLRQAATPMHTLRRRHRSAAIEHSSVEPWP
ncbi:hypothetical protein BH20CHL6_BH20CHL6_03830 [soil metagenome]